MLTHRIKIVPAYCNDRYDRYFAGGYYELDGVIYAVYGPKSEAKTYGSFTEAKQTTNYLSTCGNVYSAHVVQEEI